MKKVSVIIPVHNSEKYLRECMDSVIAQDLSEIEFLCIDDDSTDRTPEILKEYAAKDTRIRIVYDPNGSYGHKINRGITEAQGKFIGIVESDDKIEKNMFSTLYQYAEKYQADFVQSDFHAFITTREEEVQTTVSIVSDKRFYDSIVNMAAHPLLSVRTNIGIWTGLYNKDFLNRFNIRLNETPGASYQDTGFSFFTSIYAKRALFVNHAFYWYRTDNTASSTKDESKSVALVEEFKRIAEAIPKHSVVYEEIRSAYCIRKLMSYWWNIGRLTEASRTRFVEQVKEELLTDIRSDVNLEWVPPHLIRFYQSLMENSNDALASLGKHEQYVKGKYLELIAILRNYQQTVVFGAGDIGRHIISLAAMIHRKQNILCLCDNNNRLWGTECHGVPVLAPFDAVAEYPDAKYIIGNINYGDEIRNQLISLNIRNDQITMLDTRASEYQVLSFYPEL